MRFLILLLPMLLMACSDPDPQTGPISTTAYQNDYVIGRYAAGQAGDFGNSYWIEGPQGVILIGAQRRADDAIRAVSIAESYTGKKVIMAIVLHALHGPFETGEVLRQRGIRLVSAASVVDDMRTRQGAAPVPSADDPAGDGDGAVFLPEAAWQKTRAFDAAGLELKAYVVRAGESASHLLIELDDHLFVGDLVVEACHASLRLGRSEDWIERLQEIQRYARPRVIHPGRGYAMDGAHLLDAQIRYLAFFRQTLAAFYSGGRITPADRAAIAERLGQRYPDYRLQEWLAAGIDAEWEALRQRDHMMF